MNVSVLLSTLGIRAKKTGSKWVALCPSKHQEKTPSWAIIDKPGEKKHASHHCFGCNWGGGPWELAAAVWGIPVKEAGRRLRDIFGGKGGLPINVPEVVIKMPGDEKPKVFGLPIGAVIPGPGGKWYEPARVYLLARGVTQDQIDRWGIGYAIRGRLRNRVVIPVYTEGALRTYSARAIAVGVRGGRYDSGKAHMGAQPKRAVWGQPRHDHALGVVTVAEGIFSGLALERAGAPNPSALLGSELTPERARILGEFPKLLIATDPDKAGEKVARMLSILGRRARVARLRLEKSPDDEDAEQLAQSVRDSIKELGG